MGDVVGKILDGLVGVFKRNYRRPKLWIGVGMILLVFIFLIPYIDSNFFYFSRIEKRISILEKVMSLDQEAIGSNPVFLNEYQSILQEIEQQRERSFNSVLNRLGGLIRENVAAGKDEGNTAAKFFTGAMWWILIALWVPFMKTFNKRSDEILAFLLMVLVAAIMGGIAVRIPVIISPWVNYIGFPLLQLIPVIIWAVKSGSSSK